MPPVSWMSHAHFCAHMYCSGPAPAQQDDPDEIDTQHNAFSLGTFSDNEDSGPEGADIPSGPSQHKVRGACTWASQHGKVLSHATLG